MFQIEDCVHVLHPEKTWNDVPCGAGFDYVCEAPVVYIGMKIINREIMKNIWTWSFTLLKTKKYVGFVIKILHFCRSLC